MSKLRIIPIINDGVMSKQAVCSLCGKLHKNAVSAIKCCGAYTPPVVDGAIQKLQDGLAEIKRLDELRKGKQS